MHIIIPQYFEAAASHHVPCQLLVMAQRGRLPFVAPGSGCIPLEFFPQPQLLLPQGLSPLCPEPAITDRFQPDWHHDSSI